MEARKSIKRMTKQAARATLRMSRPVTTLALARAAGTDLANRRMRAEGRSAWNEDDYDAACDETHRLLRLAGLMPADDEAAP